MKLNSHQKRYMNFFKSIISGYTNEYGVKVYDNESCLYPKDLSAVSYKMLRDVHCRVTECANYSTAKIKPQDELNYLELEYIVQGRPVTILCSHTCAICDFEEDNNMFFEYGILYKPLSKMSIDLHNTIDWEHEYSEEELFMQSTVHDLDIPFLQELYRIHYEILKYYQKNNSITIHQIYHALSNYQRNQRKQK